MNVGEYNTLDLVKHDFSILYFSIIEMQENGHTFRQESWCNLDFGHQMATVCVCVCAKFQTDPVKNYITAQNVVSSLPGDCLNVPN